MSQSRVQRVAKVAGKVVVAACLMMADGARSETLNMPVVVAWGIDGQLSVPTDLVGVTQVAAGGYHTVALKSDGTVVAWGANSGGQTSVPTDLNSVTQVAAGTAHTVALKSNGTVVAWGDNYGGQTSVPTDLNSVTQVAAGAAHTVALKSTGTVVAWGDNYYGQTSVPTDLNSVTQVAAGTAHTVALKNDGTVVAWGWNGYGQTSVPSDLTGVTQVAAGRSHTVALKSNGTVVAWGDNYGGQTSIPAGLVGVAQIAAGYSHTLALKADGTVVSWGVWEGFFYLPTNLPENLTGVTQVAAGPNYTVALFEGDCNNDGLLDSAQIAANPSLDLNGNNYLDACEIARGWEEDCDQNGVIDSWQQSANLSFLVESAQLGPIGAGQPRAADLAAPPFAITDPVLEVTARGDFSLATEYLSVYLNGRFVGHFFNDALTDKNDCRSTIVRSLSMPRAFYNEMIHQGGGATSAVIEFVPSIAVNANQCPTGSWVKAKLRYVAAVAGDCNANGLLDLCEARDFPDTDTNGNGIVDSCETYSLVFDCPGDLDGGGSVDTADLSLLLMSFGAAMPGDPADLDASGQIDNADLSLMLLSFGDC